MREELSPRSQAALANVDASLAELRTRRIRAAQLALPEIPIAGPEDFAAAAKAADAAPELRAVARAVAQGRVTWQDVADGRIDAAPEIRDLVAAGSARAVEAERETERPARRPRAAADEDDFSQTTFMYDPLA